MKPSYQPIKTASILIMTLEAVLENIDPSALPERYTSELRHTIKSIRLSSQSGDIERRDTPVQHRYTGVIRTGDRSHSVTIHPARHDQFIIESPIWVKEGEIIGLEYPEDNHNTSHMCNIHQCRPGTRDDDGADIHYLVAKAVSTTTDS